MKSVNPDPSKEGSEPVKPGIGMAAGKIDEELVASIYDRIDTAVWVFDFDHKRFLWANRRTLEITEASSLEELQLRDLAADMSPSVARRLRQYQQDFCKKDVTFSEIWTLYPKGKPKVLQMNMSGIRLTDGRMGLLCEAREHHEQQPETLRSAEALMHTTVMISLFAKDGQPLYRNTAARAACVDLNTTFAGQFIDAADAGKLFGSVEENGDARRVARVRTCAGPRWHEVTVRHCQDAVTGKPAYLVSEIDVTELHETKERAQYLASHDTLTGLSNRTFLRERLTKLIDRARTAGSSALLYLVDLDDFKLINDTQGHAAGDALLQLVADKLNDLTGPDDIVARLGGDEFLICHIEHPDTLHRDWFGRSLLKEFSSEQLIEGKPRKVGLSIGYVRYPDDGATIEDLMSHGDLALYQAKSNTTSKCVRFRKKMRLLRDEHLAVKKDLERAIEKGEFVLHYQPIANTVTDRVISAEALIRWQHPERGLVLPDDFIPVAEETGLIDEIGAWVLQKVGRMQAELGAQGYDIPLALNVSPRQLADPFFTVRMQHLEADTGCRPGSLSLEITEGVLMGDIPKAQETLSALKKVGYRIVIDDFGTGYSNLAFLKNYEIDGIKIDRSFMDDIAEGGAIVKLILSLARAMEADVVAEGVETVEQRLWLSKNGCDLFQGFLYSRPVPEERLLSMLRAQVQIAAM